MARTFTTQDEAFDRLRIAGQSLHLKLRDIASEAIQSPRAAKINALGTVLESNRIINVAIGMIMEQSQIEPNDARPLFTAATETTGRSMVRVARDYVETGQV
jgi:hypothetical protein